MAREKAIYRKAALTRTQEASLLEKVAGVHRTYDRAFRLDKVAAPAAVQKARAVVDKYERQLDDISIACADKVAELARRAREEVAFADTREDAFNAVARFEQNAAAVYSVAKKEARACK